MEKLSDYLLTTDPLESFRLWYEKACQDELNPEAFTLATASKEGVPSARILLLKGFRAGNYFRFFTHSTSQKGSELKENPWASMVFYWVKGERQVRINGEVLPLERSETQKYFSSRAHESQVASFISEQSEAIESREKLEEKFSNALKKFPEGQVPFPENWKGYELKASTMEFFVYGKHRLNDRFLYQKNTAGTWDIKRLQP